MAEDTAGYFQQILAAIAALREPTPAQAQMEAVMERFLPAFVAPAGTVPLQVFLKTWPDAERVRLFDFGWGQDAMRRTKIQSWIFESVTMGFVDPSSARTLAVRALLVG